MQGPNLAKYLDEMNGAATEQEQAETPTPLPPSPPEQRTVENPSAKSLVRLYLLVALPFFGGVLVAVECRVVFGMYQLLALAGGVAFGRWAFHRRPSVESVSTLQHAWELASRTTARLGAVPVAAGLAFLFVDRTLGVVWAYAVALVVTLLCAGVDDSRVAAPVSTEETERGRKQGGIDDKLRDEYEKVRREHSGQG